MRKNYVTNYWITALAATALVTALSLSNAPFFLAVFHLLPLSIAIAVIELIGAESITAFFLIFIPTSLVLNLLVFIPVLCASKFKTLSRMILTQVISVIIYVALSMFVFNQTGSWASV